MKQLLSWCEGNVYRIHLGSALLQAGKWKLEGENMERMYFVSEENI